MFLALYGSASLEPVSALLKDIFVWVVVKLCLGIGCKYWYWGFGCLERDERISLLFWGRGILVRRRRRSEDCIVC